jgi:phosphoribosylformylglycinamidine synthase subunit PurL
VGGNVSLYNEGPQGPIYPTPVVGLVGELPDAARAGASAFRAPGSGAPDMIALVGPFSPSLAGSELANLRGELEAGLPPFDLAKVRRALELVREAVCEGTVASAHDVSDGGLACAVIESALAGNVGASLELDPLMKRAGVDALAALFGEGPGGVVVSGSRERLLELSAGAAGIGFLALGTVGGSGVRLAAGDATIDLSLEDARGAFESGLGKLVP